MRLLSRLLAAIILLSVTTAIANAQKTPPVLNHIAVYVHDLQTCTSFYQNILQLDTVPEPFHDGRHSWFNIGNNSRLHLIQGAVSVTGHDKNNHLCFSVTALNDFIAVLQQNNIEYENWKGEKNAVTHRVDGVQQIYFRDPEGYWLEVNDAKE